MSHPGSLFIFVTYVSIILVILTIPVSAEVEIHSFTPESGVNTGQETITLTGIGFTTVSFYNVILQAPGFTITPVGFTIESDNKMTTRFNLGAKPTGLYDIVLITATGDKFRSQIPFKILYPFYPVITSISPDSARVIEGRKNLEIQGNNFTPLTSAQFISSSGSIILVSTVFQDEDNLSLDFTPENGQGGAYIVETVNDDGQRSSDTIHFTIYDLPPRVDSVLPDNGSNAEPEISITISGTNFREGCTIRLTQIESDATLTNTTQTTVSPDGKTCSGEIDISEAEPGDYTLSIINPDGQESTDSILFTQVNTVPAVESVTPIESPISASPVNLTVRGERFREGCTIRLMHTESDATITNTTQTAVSPDGKTCSGELDLSVSEPGEYILSIINPDGQESEGVITFTILPPEEREYTIHITSGPGGKTSPSGTITVKEDTDLSLSFLPDSGYAIWNIIFDGIAAGKKTSLHLSDINENHFVHADFYLEKPLRCPTINPTPVITPEPSPSEYYVHTRTDYGSYIIPEGDLPVPAGSDMTFSIGVDDGFHLADIQVNDHSVGLLSQVTLRGITSNQSIRVLSERDLTSHLAYFEVSHQGKESKTVQLNSTSYPDVPWEFWNFGDGTTSFGGDTFHTYTKPGNYSIEHQVVFRNGSSRCNREVEIKR